jgi:hypothetical protein
MNTPVPIRAGAYNRALFWILQLSPTVTPLSMKTLRPIVQPAPTMASVRIWVRSQIVQPSPIDAPVSMTAEVEMREVIAIL